MGRVQLGIALRIPDLEPAAPFSVLWVTALRDVTLAVERWLAQLSKPRQGSWHGELGHTWRRIGGSRRGSTPSVGRQCCHTERTCPQPGGAWTPSRTDLVSRKLPPSFCTNTVNGCIAFAFVLLVDLWRRDACCSSVNLLSTAFGQATDWNASSVMEAVQSRGGQLSLIHI